MREVGRSRSKAGFEQRAERKTRAHRKSQLQMQDEFWSLSDQLEELREEDSTSEQS